MSVWYSKIDLLGYAGNDPKPLPSESGADAVSFSLALNRVWTDSADVRQEATDWFSIIARGKLAENCLAWLTKGRLVFVTGMPRVSSWSDEAGARRERVQVIANQIVFLDN